MSRSRLTFDEVAAVTGYTKRAHFNLIVHGNGSQEFLDACERAVADLIAQNLILIHDGLKNATSTGSGVAARLEVRLGEWAAKDEEVPA